MVNKEIYVIYFHFKKNPVNFGVLNNELESSLTPFYIVLSCKRKYIKNFAELYGKSSEMF